MPGGRRKGTQKTGGRKKGTTNVVSADLRQMILDAAKEVGGVKYLVRQAEENPNMFMQLWGKILPKVTEADISVNGSIDHNIQVDWASCILPETKDANPDS